MRWKLRIFSNLMEGKTMRRASFSGWRKKHRISLYPLRQVFGLSVLLLAMVMISGPAAAEMATVSLDFEVQALDLDTGLIVERATGDPASLQEADVSMAYNADRTPHAVVFTLGVRAEIAVMAGVVFDWVFASDIGSLEFCIEPPDVPFEATDTVVIRTTAGSVFKLGNASETEEWVTFDYERLQ
jgi:hypothetical protein